MTKRGLPGGTIIDSLNRAQALREGGYLDEAIATLEEGIRRRKGRKILGKISNYQDLQNLLKEVRLEKAQRDLGQARKFFHEYQDADDPLEMLHRAHRLAQSVLEFQDTTEARDLADRIRTVRERFLVQEGVERIRARFLRGDARRAYEDVTGLLEETPNDPQLQDLETEIRRGLVDLGLQEVEYLQQRGDQEGVQNKLEELLVLDPDRDDVKQKLADWRYRLDRVKNDLEKALDLCNDNRYSQAIELLDMLAEQDVSPAALETVRQKVRQGLDREAAARAGLEKAKACMQLSDGPGASLALSQARQKAPWLSEINTCEAELARRFGPSDRFRVQIGGRIFVVLMEEHLAIGRNTKAKRKNHVYCACPDISRSPLVHLLRQGRRFFIEHSDSSGFGATVEGQPVKGKKEIKAGNQVGIGQMVTLTFQVVSGAVPTGVLSVEKYSSEYPENTDLHFIQLGSRLCFGADVPGGIFCFPGLPEVVLEHESGVLVLKTQQGERRVLVHGLEWNLGPCTLMVEEEHRWPENTP